MNKAFVSIVKVEYRFAQEDGSISSVNGIEVRLAPKVKKFISMNKDNLELLELMQNGLAQWYQRAEVGDDLILAYAFDTAEKKRIPII